MQLESMPVASRCFYSRFLKYSKVVCVEMPSGSGVVWIS